MSGGGDEDEHLALGCARIAEGVKCASHAENRLTGYGFAPFAIRKELVVAFDNKENFIFISDGRGVAGHRLEARSE